MRIHQHMTDELEAGPLPMEAGAMLLEGVCLFPKALLPLHIFENRYRLMLAHALDRQRMFAIAPQAANAGRSHGIGGLGLVRACVRNSDGTSNLVLQGVVRVCFDEWLQCHPFPAARVTVIESRNADTPAAIELAERARMICRDLLTEDHGLPAALDTVRDPGELCDLIAATFVSEPEVCLRLLGEPDVPSRLEFLNQWLETAA